jgi:lysophospholipase L1-like esterase
MATIQSFTGKLLAILLILSAFGVNGQRTVNLKQASGQTGNGPFDFKNGSIVVFAGGTNVANMRKDAYLETMLLVGNPQKRLHIRNLGWDGDTVDEQFRDVGFGSWTRSIDSLRADVVFVQFGQMESLRGLDALESFVASYKTLLGKIKKDGREIVVIAPVPFEPGQLLETVENPLEKAPLERYATEIKKMAASLGLSYIDVYYPLKEFSKTRTLTSNGIHLTDEGQKLMATIIANELGLHQAFSVKFEPLRQEVLKKNVLWFNYWRPGNWAFLYGDRMTVPFSHDWVDKNKRIFPEEMKAFEKLMQDAENQIAAGQEKAARIN